MLITMEEFKAYTVRYNYFNGCFSIIDDEGIAYNWTKGGYVYDLRNNRRYSVLKAHRFDLNKSLREDLYKLYLKKEKILFDLNSNSIYLPYSEEHKEELRREKEEYVFYNSEFGDMYEHKIIKRSSGRYDLYFEHGSDDMPFFTFSIGKNFIEDKEEVGCYQLGVGHKFVYTNEEDLEELKKLNDFLEDCYQNNKEVYFGWFDNVTKKPVYKVVD